MKRIKIAFLFFFFGIWIASCSSDNPTAQDTEPPVITISSPKNGDSFKKGSVLTFEAVFEDNQELAIYNINIHENFDGHSHGRVAASPLAFDKSFNISGKRAAVTEKIEIPSDAVAGDYHFIVRAIDNARNATGFADGSTKEIAIKIVD